MEPIYDAQDMAIADLAEQNHSLKRQVATLEQEQARLQRDKAEYLEIIQASGERIDALVAEQARLQAEVNRFKGINGELCSEHNGLLADGARWQRRAEEAEAEQVRLREQLAAEKDLLRWADRLAAALNAPALATVQQAETVAAMLTRWREKAAACIAAGDIREGWTYEQCANDVAAILKAEPEPSEKS